MPPTTAPVAVPRRFVWVSPLLVVVAVMAVPAVVSGRPVPGAEASALVGQVLSAPLAYSVPALLPLAKALLVVVGAMAVGGVRQSPRILVAYYAASLVVTGFFQNAAVIPGRGLAFLTGNAVAQLGLAGACLVALRRVPAEPSVLRRGRLWVLPLMLVAAAFPYVVTDGHVSPGSDGALTNGAGVTGCMVTAVVAGALFLRPDAIPASLRVAVGGFGVVFGLLNLVTWFVLSPQSWWMGVLHLPLFVCSMALTITSWTAGGRPDRRY